MKSIVEEIFGSKVFDESVMREKLAKDTYRELEKTIHDGKQLNIKIANAVAHAMKEWALEQGATHYTHWFQPMTGVTAEKHDGFINPDKDGKVNGKILCCADSEYIYVVDYEFIRSCDGYVNDWCCSKWNICCVVQASIVGVNFNRNIQSGVELFSNP